MPIPDLTCSDAVCSADDALMANTAEVTDGLRRTMQLMQQELDRSLESNELLGTYLPPIPSLLSLRASLHASDLRSNRRLADGYDEAHL